MGDFPRPSSFDMLPVFGFLRYEERLTFGEKYLGIIKVFCGIGGIAPYQVSTMGLWILARDERKEFFG